VPEKVKVFLMADAEIDFCRDAQAHPAGDVAMDAGGIWDPD